MLNRTDAEILLEARDIIAGKGYWCQGHLARDVNGDQVDIIDFIKSDTTAMSYCLEGAIVKALGNPLLNLKQYDRIIDHVCKTINDLNFVEWNDDPERTQAQVIGALDTAAKLAKEACINVE